MRLSGSYEAQGVGSLHPEHELTLEYGDALESIDNIFLFKIFLFKELARERLWSTECC